MTLNLQFRSLRIETRAGHEATYRFSPRVNTIVGPFGSGKTSLLELLKYGIGGSGELSQTVEQEVAAVVVECKLGATAWRFRRKVGDTLVEVFDLAGTLETTLHTRAAGKRERPSNWLLNALGVPPLRVRRAKQRASGVSEPVSFFDFYAYAYLAQSEIDRSVVGHRDRDRDRKRKAVFEFMFGLIDERLSLLEVEEGQLAEQAQRLKREKEAIERFLEQASTPPRESLRAALESALREVQTAQARLAQLKADASAATAQAADRRSEVSALVNATQRLRSRLSALEVQVHERARLDANLTLEIERVSRAASAAIALSGLDFTRCPRCLQAVRETRAERGHCYLCGQTEPSAATDAGRRDESELRRLRTLRSEVRDLLTSDEEDRRALRFELGLLEEQMMANEAVLVETETAAVAPLFDAIAAASADISDGQSRRHRAGELMRYWDELDRLESDLAELQAERSELSRLIDEVKARLERGRGAVVEFAATFREVVAEAQLPWFEDASIDMKTYLPVVNGGSFEALSSGGMKAVVNVAYHLALLTEGLIERELRIPNLLIIDSPAKNLGVGRNDRAQADRVYRRIAALVGAHDQDFQIIVADNDPPGVPVPLANAIELSYDRPLVPGVVHPGPGVPTIGDDPDALP